MRYFFRIAYDGTHYAGWQRQSNAVTIQETIEIGLATITGSELVSIVGCGRTDAGVHANSYFFHVDLDTTISIEQLRYKLNQVLPRDIAIREVRNVDVEAHARFDAISRSYIYHLHTEKDPFVRRFSSYYPMARRMDFSLLEATAQMLLKYQDFSTFCKTHTDVKHKICLLKESRWIQGADGQSYTYHITSDRFLRGMVRLIVGTSIHVAVGKLDIDYLEKAIGQGVKPKHIFSAPPEGLFLSHIQYPYL